MTGSRIDGDAKSLQREGACRQVGKAERRPARQGKVRQRVK